MSGVVPIRPVTAAEAAEAFLSFLRRNDRSAKTLRRYRPILAATARPPSGSRTPQATFAGSRWTIRAS
jgi:hypothetical protein